MKMTNNLKKAGEYVKHPGNDGVFMKHFYGKDDTDGKMNNVEILIVSGFQIAPHVHGSSDEYFYIVSGTGEYQLGEETIAIEKGDVFTAPPGVSHAVVNTGTEPLLLLSTFCPPIR
jgi:mannose-6-phosphate isomerase-like protein (cupin superfamily)